MSKAFIHEPWIYKGEPFEVVPEGIENFVYILTDIVTGRKYIGKKSFVSVSRGVNEKGRTKITRKESDWKKYYSSNLELIQFAKGGNGRRIHREILWLCPNKGTASYLEAKEIFTRGCLEDPEKWHNQYIEVMVTSKHLKLEGIK